MYIVKKQRAYTSLQQLHNSYRYELAGLHVFDLFFNRVGLFGIAGFCAKRMFTYSTANGYTEPDE
jgi:hypothetical protein